MIINTKKNQEILPSAVRISLYMQITGCYCNIPKKSYDVYMYVVPISLVMTYTKVFQTCILMIY